ncbi:MAG: hydroxysqualene dehydroxylase HpnE [Gammaproteobacteria bacterium]|nr:hydroxysqualene dehydroxylase HpnE [Gammaproteobacteria bacterium]MCW8840470.1 hydroxysqualene dehydroxylase HpnE [Gammaproteobacteria bacterium]MCW8957730.1 hydroxysqualene dehydroxylase HpnE [Gammaproteobacteria bacterium]MCW8973940.1 hydroxysqualene dehydroxylase HpnE [Gammaproteobacteria bacterium]MCW8993056.1 hydroxysqualene dehydroxylase HpnE [Gammaproteobacteria bacterium]
MSESERVIIAGAGWAGMAAALELDRHNIPVTVLESAPRLGGRARTVVLDDTLLDNGQHLLIGAYHETLRVLALMGLKEQEVLHREPLHLEVLGHQGSFSISASKLPAPLHLVWGLLSARGITPADKLHALRMSLSLALKGYRLEQDISVAALLDRHRQGSALVRSFWQPLCLATLNTPLHQASATVFLRVLQDSFSHAHRDSDLLIPRVPLGKLFCESAAGVLERKPHNRLCLRTRVTGVAQENGMLSAQIGDAETHTGGDLILATSPAAASRLLAPLPQSAAQAQASAIAELGVQPIATVYLYYPDAPALSFPMLGLDGTVSQWIFDRRICNQHGWYAVVISAEGEHCQWDKEQLAREVQQELGEILPHWPATADKNVVIREKRATFECRVDIESLRPDNTTAVDGLWLAGDYTATGYPATLEGAVRSGVQCARRIIDRRNNRT